MYVCPKHTHILTYSHAHRASGKQKTNMSKNIYHCTFHFTVNPWRKQKCVSAYYFISGFYKDKNMGED